MVVAQETAANLHLLCVDELHVTDVADAMVLSNLFGTMLKLGCCLVFTSNRPARDLYKGGLSRKYFLPFIDLIDEHMLQLKVASGCDYRLLKHSSRSTGQRDCQDTTAAAEGSSVGDSSATASDRYFMGHQGTQQLQRLWQKTRNGRPVIPCTVPLPFGRQLWMPKAVEHSHASCSEPSNSTGPPQPGTTSPPQQQQQQKQQLHVQNDSASAHHDNTSAGGLSTSELVQGQSAGIRASPNHPQRSTALRTTLGHKPIAAAYFTFEQLCGGSGCRAGVDQGGPLSAIDYLAVAHSCDTVFLEHIPELSIAQRDEARRLVTLIDILYEAGTTLYCSADASPADVFVLLLRTALAAGVNPNLGRAQKVPVDKLKVSKKWTYIKH